MTPTCLDSYAGLKTSTLNNHKPEALSEKKRRELKNAFRLAINKSRSLAEARRLNKLRTKFFSPGGMTEDEAILAWLEVSLMSKPGRPGQSPANGRFHVAAA